jgi:hypothetical protein
MDNPCIAPGGTNNLAQPLNPSQLPIAQGLPGLGFTVVTRDSQAFTVPMEKASYQAYDGPPMPPQRTNYQP